MSTVIKFKHDQYETLCYEMSEALREEKELKARIKQLKAKVVEMSGGERMEFGVSVKEKSRIGSISYKDLLAEYVIPEEDVERYRGPRAVWWEVSNY